LNGQISSIPTGECLVRWSKIKAKIKSMMVLMQYYPTKLSSPLRVTISYNADQRCNFENLKKRKSYLSVQMILCYCAAEHKHKSTLSNQNSSQSTSHVLISVSTNRIYCHVSFHNSPTDSGRKIINAILKSLANIHRHLSPKLPRPRRQLLS
jgi:hypothetical protein